MVENWLRVRSERVHDYGIFKVRRDESRSPRTERVHQFRVLEMSNWANVIPLTPEGKVVMIRQYRHGTEEVALEIPGGIVDDEDASLAAAASWRKRPATRPPRW